MTPRGKPTNKKVEDARKKREAEQAQRAKAAREAVLVLLDAETPMKESELLALGKASGFKSAEIKDATAVLHNRNEIRWVAFHGYCLGGRPS